MPFLESTKKVNGSLQKYVLEWMSLSKLKTISLKYFICNQPTMNFFLYVTITIPCIVGSRSGRRYTGRATCDCPNCQEADRLGPAGIHLKKRNIHSCHIPGCGEYNFE